MTKQDKEQTAEEYLEKRTYLCYCGNLRKEIVLHSDVLKALSLKEQEVKKGFNELRDVDDEVIKELKEDNKILETLSYGIDKAKQQGKQEERARCSGFVKELIDIYEVSLTCKMSKKDRTILEAHRDNLIKLTSKIKGDKE